MTDATFKSIDFSQKEYEYLNKIVFPKIQSSYLFIEKKLIFHDEKIGQPSVRFINSKNNIAMYTLRFLKINNNPYFFQKDSYEYILELIRFLDDKDVHASKRKYELYRCLSEENAKDFGGQEDFDPWGIDILPKNLGISIKKFLEFFYKKKFKKITKKEHIKLFEETGFK